MTKFQTTFAAAVMLLMLGASTLPAPAQTESASNASCSVQSAAARPLTQYPAERPNILAAALVDTLTGTTLVRIDLTEDGTPQNPTVVKSSGNYQLDQAAKTAVLSQRFAPEIRDCQNVAGSYLYEVTFDY